MPGHPLMRSWSSLLLLVTTAHALHLCPFPLAIQLLAPAFGAAEAAHAARRGSSAALFKNFLEELARRMQRPLRHQCHAATHRVSQIVMHIARVRHLIRTNTARDALQVPQLLDQHRVVVDADETLHPPWLCFEI